MGKIRSKQTCASLQRDFLADINDMMVLSFTGVIYNLILRFLCWISLHVSVFSSSSEAVNLWDIYLILAVIPD